MREPDLETLLFFEGRPGALALYGILEERISGAFPDAKKRVQKTQITFFARRVFACVSFARVKRKAELPAEFITVTFGLGAPLDSPRIAAKTEPYPGRWTHHTVVGRPEEIDEELFSWIREAYAFAESK